LRLATTATEGLANIDQIGYVSPGLSKGACVVTDLAWKEISSPISIYPNPFSNALSIRVAGNFDYVVYSLVGSALERGKGQEQVSLGEHLPAGVYLLEILRDGARKQLKVEKRDNH